MSDTNKENQDDGSDFAFEIHREQWTMIPAMVHEGSAESDVNFFDKEFNVSNKSVEAFDLRVFNHFAAAYRQRIYFPLMGWLRSLQ